MKGVNEPSKGFLISCDKNREKEALRDAYNFISEYIEEIYSDVTEQNIIKKIKDDGKEVTLENEIKYQKQKQNRLLTQVETNVNCLIFIKINPHYPQIDPLVVVDKIMKDVHQNGREITRYCHRILPVERAFKAEHFRMLDTIDQLVNIHSQGGEIRSWMLNFKCRNNNKFNYKEVLKEVTIIANKHSHFTDIYYPQWTISVQINNHLMCISIAEKFKETNEFKLHKNIPKHERKIQKQQETQRKDRYVQKSQTNPHNKNRQEKKQSSQKANKNDDRKEEQNQVKKDELQQKAEEKQKKEAMLKQTFNIPEEDIDFF